MLCTARKKLYTTVYGPMRMRKGTENGRYVAYKAIIRTTTAKTTITEAHNQICVLPICIHRTPALQRVEGVIPIRQDWYGIRGRPRSRLIPSRFDQTLLTNQKSEEGLFVSLSRNPTKPYCHRGKLGRETGTREAGLGRDDDENRSPSIQMCLGRGFHGSI